MSFRSRGYTSFIFVSALASLSNTALASPTAANLSNIPAPNQSTATSSLIKKFKDNDQITDAKLRADAGSLSQFSMRFSLSYYGPSPTDLGALDQPNPDHLVVPTATAVSGNVGFRYRLSSSSSISLYAGLSDEYAFHPRQSLDINSPSLSYDHTFRLGKVQFLSSPSLTLVTQKVYKDHGEIAGAGYYLSGVYNIGKTRFAVGSENSIGYYFFNNDYTARESKTRRMNISISPFLKYRLTPNLNLNTSSMITLYNLRKEDTVFNLGSRRVYQKVGVGYAFNRDVYVQPYLEFYPTHMRFNETTINLLTSFSLL